MRVGDLVWACCTDHGLATTHRILSIIVQFDRHVPTVCFVMPVNSTKKHKWYIGAIEEVICE
jgi:hypothetical protein